MRFALATMFLLSTLPASAVRAVSLVPVALDVTRIDVSTRITSPGSQFVTGEGPEIELAWSLENDEYVSGGAAVGRVEGHRVFVESAGELVPKSAARFSGLIETSTTARLSFTVPDFGFPSTTLILRGHELIGDVGGGFEQLTGWLRPPGGYQSATVGGTVPVAPFGATQDVFIGVGTGLVGTFIAGDRIGFNVNVRVIGTGPNALGGTIDAMASAEVLAVSPVPEPHSWLLAVSLLALARLRPRAARGVRER